MLPILIEKLTLTKQLAESVRMEKFNLQCKANLQEEAIKSFDSVLQGKFQLENKTNLPNWNVTPLLGDFGGQQYLSQKVQL